MVETKEVNLFSDDVVIIIGAGASVPFGLPTGLDLIEFIVNRLEDEEKTIKNKYFSDNPYNTISNSYIIEDCPLFGALEEIPYSGQTHKNVILERVSRLSQWLKQQVSDSIDDLIRYNDDKASDLKKCIAFELLMRSGNNQKDGFERRNFDERNVIQVDKKQKEKKDKTTNETIRIRNWVHNLINIARMQFLYNWGTFENWEASTDKTRIKIINFNYDSILEDIIEDNWEKVGTKLPARDDVFEIVHPHGKIQIPKNLNLNEIAHWVLKNYTKIAVIHDIKNSDVQPDREKAKDFISLCADIYAIGFAFAKLNCDLLGLDKIERINSSRCTINYINFDKNSGLDLRVNRYCRDGIALHPIGYNHAIISNRVINEKGDYLQITDALMGGFLGEMPS